jgi:hypothetical protein
MQERINSFDKVEFQTGNRGKVNNRGIKIIGNTICLSKLTLNINNLNAPNQTTQNRKLD